MPARKLNEYAFSRRSIHGLQKMSVVTHSGIKALTAPMPEPSSTIDPGTRARFSRIRAYNWPYTTRSKGFLSHATLFRPISTRCRPAGLCFNGATLKFRSEAGRSLPRIPVQTHLYQVLFDGLFTCSLVRQRCLYAGIRLPHSHFGRILQVPLIPAIFFGRCHLGVSGTSILLVLEKDKTTAQKAKT